MTHDSSPPPFPSNPSDRAVSPEDVARAAGVSLVTVSRALNNSHRVSPETRDRVLEVARQLGYRPNSTARALRKGQTNTVAIVLKSGHLFSAFHSEMLAGFYSVVHERELRVMLTVVAPDEEKSGLWLSQLTTGAGFDALVLHQELVRGLFPELGRLAMPVVLAGLLANPTEDERIFPMVGFDHVAGTMQAVRHLAALGHSRIAYFHDPGPAYGPSVRPDAFRAGMAEAGHAVRPEWLVTLQPGQGAEAGSRTISQIYGGPPPYPTAVICPSDLAAAGVVEGADAWGRRVPEDLSVVAYGNFPWAAHFRPPLTAIHQSGWELGQVLGRKLLDVRDGRRDQPGTVALPMELVIRQSTGPAPEVGGKFKT